MAHPPAMDSHDRTRRLLTRGRRRFIPHAPPGALVSAVDAPPPRLRLVAYGPDGIDERDLAGVADVEEHIGRHAVAWLDVSGTQHVETLRELGRVFSLHRLALEDVINVGQRPKTEDYEDVHYVVTRMLALTVPAADEVRDHERGASWQPAVTSEQVSLFFAPGWVVTVQEREGDCFEGVRRRIRSGKGVIRRQGADYLAYALLDAVVDGYFPVIDHLGAVLDALEETVLAEPDEDAMSAIQQAKRDVLSVRRFAVPQREALGALLRSDSDALCAETRLHLRDCLDHAVQLIDLLDTQRELASGLMDLHVTVVSNRTNEAMKVLTIVATIFIPLSFIAGLYGMNFDPSASPWNMPELSWSFGYPFALLLMAATAGTFIAWFVRKGWLGGGRRARRRRRTSQRDGRLSE